MASVLPTYWASPPSTALLHAYVPEEQDTQDEDLTRERRASASLLLGLELSECGLGAHGGTSQPLRGSSCRPAFMKSCFRTRGTRGYIHLINLFTLISRGRGFCKPVCGPGEEGLEHPQELMNSYGAAPRNAFILEFVYTLKGSGSHRSLPQPKTTPGGCRSEPLPAVLVLGHDGAGCCAGQGPGSGTYLSANRAGGSRAAWTRGPAWRSTLLMQLCSEPMQLS